jgi:hypothetical protein
LHHACFQESMYFVCLNAIFDVRLYPLLDGLSQIGLPMHECHPRAVSKKI